MLRIFPLSEVTSLAASYKLLKAINIYSSATNKVLTCSHMQIVFISDNLKVCRKYIHIHTERTVRTSIVAFQMKKYV